MGSMVLLKSAYFLLLDFFELSGILWKSCAFGVSELLLAVLFNIFLALVSLSNRVVLVTFELGRFGVADSTRLIVVLCGFGRGSTGAWNEKLSIHPAFDFCCLLLSAPTCSGLLGIGFFLGLIIYCV